jgi:cytochrome c peroxidase
VATRYGEAYEAVFGALPKLDALPDRGKPGMEAWDALPADVREDIDEVAANVGKALEAYERQLTCADTKFDRWTRGEASLTDREERGAEAFVEHHCNRCHSGPAFSDGKFHDIALPSSDPGRSAGRTLLLADDFNGAGLNSDDPIAGEAKLASVSSETATVGAFRTASLRGVGQRTFFGHASHRSTLRGFIEDVYHGRHGGRDATVGRRDPLLRGVNVPHHELDEIVAFLHTLDCPPVAPALIAH